MMPRDRWPTEKARLNHDVLGNQVAPAVSYLIRVLEGRVEDESAVRLFVTGEVVQWESLERDLRAVINGFEHEMSPGRMFESAPLNVVSDEDKAWMTALVHDSWWERNGMKDRRDACACALEKCGNRWGSLVEELTELLALTDSRSIERGAGHSPQAASALAACRSFHTECRGLRQALTRLPSTIVVIPEA
jgi:hypothetical protein